MPLAFGDIESSALVAALLERDADALKSVRTRGRKVTSSLTIAEAARAILRARAAGRLTTDQERAAVRALRRFERRCYLVPRRTLSSLECAGHSQSNLSEPSMPFISRQRSCWASLHR